MALETFSCGPFRVCVFQAQPLATEVFWELTPESKKFRMSGWGRILWARGIEGTKDTLFEGTKCQFCHVLHEQAPPMWPPGSG